MKFTTPSVRSSSSHDRQTVETLLKTENTKQTPNFPVNLETKGTKQKC